MSPLADRLDSLATTCTEYVRQLEGTPHADPQSVVKYKQVASDLRAAVKLIENRR